MTDAMSGAEFKKELRAGRPKFGMFLNSHSPTVAEQLAHSGYDWLLVDTQHGPMGNESLSGMLAGIANGGATSMVRVGGYSDRPCIQQSLDMGADGVLVPYINTADEARAEGGRACAASATAAGAAAGPAAPRPPPAAGAAARPPPATAPPGAAGARARAAGRRPAGRGVVFSPRGSI